MTEIKDRAIRINKGRKRLNIKEESLIDNKNTKLA
jgi:hypothetical protein